MRLWISIESGVEGDITLTAEGSALRDHTFDVQATPPLVIATAVSPVTIHTDTTNLRIGYQFQTVHDIEIRETEAGMLQAGKNVRVSVTDFISEDITFTPGFRVSVGDGGDLRIRNLRTLDTGNAFSSNLIGSGLGTIAFDIATA
jgi:hypothetical protein